jgi:hypothetical protein
MCVTKEPYSIHEDCTISTPQFKHCKVDKMLTQSGVFNNKSFLFTTHAWLGHDVQFQSIEHFKRFRVDKKKGWLSKLLGI